MLEFVTATRYDKRMKNGKTKPCLMAAAKADDTVVELVVKFSGGCDRATSVVRFGGGRDHQGQGPQTTQPDYECLSNSRSLSFVHAPGQTRR